VKYTRRPSRLTSTICGPPFKGSPGFVISFVRSVREDVAAVFENDPAARSYFEVLFCYRRLHAVWAHHLTYWLWQHHFR